jgi:hypothetical protein
MTGHRKRPALTAVSTALLLTGLVVAGTAGLDAVPGTRGSQAHRDRFTLAVLRADGILLPFASVDGDRWETPWPANVAAVDLPINLDSVPERWWGRAVPTHWRLWPRDGQAPREIKPVAPMSLFIGTMRRIGLRTDLRDAAMPVPPFEVPFPKLGLVIGGDAEVKPIVHVSSQAPARGQLLADIRRDLEAAEQRTLDGLRTYAGWRHPLEAVRAQIAVELEAWYTTALTEPGRRVSYIEAVKKYPLRGEDRGCGLETFISGWIHHRDDQKQVRTALKAVVGYCDREKASYILPFGQMTVRNRTHWVFQMSGQDHEWYEVAELMPGRVRFVAEYHAGGHPAF